MSQKRREMTVRVVPLQSAAAGDGRVGGTADERLKLLEELSRQMWIQTGRPFPTYTRAEMPVRVIKLSDK
jgi:hypothetical protein